LKKDRPKQKKGRPRKEYRPPHLTVYGRLAELTGKHLGTGDAKGRAGIFA
jgi:hypothetical protein